MQNIFIYKQHVYIMYANIFFNTKEQEKWFGQLLDLMVLFY